MRFDRESWRKLYVAESLDHRRMPLFARGLRDYLLRFAREDGTLLESTQDPIGDLGRTLGAQPAELEQLAAYVEELLDVGYLTLERHAGERDASVRASQTERDAGRSRSAFGGVTGVCTLRVTRFRDGQESARTAAAERARRYRERKAAKQGQDQPPPDDGPGPGSGRDGERDAERDATRARPRARIPDPTRPDENYPTRRRSAGRDASVTESVTRPVTPSRAAVAGSSKAGENCPGDLVARAVRAGVVSELADEYSTTIAAIEDALAEFVRYWTKGGGAGAVRADWMARARQRVKELHERGRLKAPGELEHEGRKRAARMVKPRPRQPQATPLTAEETRELAERALARNKAGGT